MSLTNLNYSIYLLLHLLTAFAILILKTVTSEEYESNKTKFKTEKETKKMDAKQNKKSGANNQSNDPFSQYTGWHNGKEEVRGHPSMVLDIHCSKLRFAISETQVDTMIKINEKTTYASEYLLNAMKTIELKKKTNTLNPTTNIGTTTDTIMSLSNTNVVTTKDVMAMLDVANYNVEQEDLLQKKGKRKQKQEQNKATNGSTSENNEKDNNEEDNEGVVSGLLNWAWNSIVGEEDEETINDEEQEEEEQLVRSKLKN